LTRFKRYKRRLPERKHPYGIDPAWMNKHAITVRSGKLSDYITGPVDYLKIDVEGAEDTVMQDLMQSGKLRQVQSIPEVIIEASLIPAPRAGCE
jgi:FkbM family methyltransferase